MNNSPKIVLFPIQTKKGFPIRIRYKRDGDYKYINLGYYLTKGERNRYWNKKKNELRSFYPEYDKVLAEFKKQKKLLAIESPTNSSSLIDYFQNYIDTLTINKQYGLRQKAVSVFKHLKKYSGGEILFSELSVKYLNDLKLYFTKNNLEPITQKGYFEKLRKIINNAIVEDVYAPTKHPFLGFEYKDIKVKPKHLEPDELEYLKNFKPKDEKANKAKIKWLFQYFAFGMRVSDLLLLKFSDIKEYGTRIKYMMYKTKDSMGINLNTELLKLIFEYNFSKEMQRIAFLYFSDADKNEKGYYEHLRKLLSEYATTSTIKNTRIFSNIDPDLEDEILYKKVSSQTGIYNKDLKTLSRELNKNKKYDFNLSSHQARHTFAYISILQKKNIYYISKALNHKSVRTTEKYLRKFDTKELDNMFYDSDVNKSDKKIIDDKLNDFIKNANYLNKKKVVDFIEMIQFN